MYTLSPGIAAGQVELLLEMAAGGPVLELGVGTGRIALPLAAAGIGVHCIDSSPAMVGQLRDKPGATPSESQWVTFPTSI